MHIDHINISAPKVLLEDVKNFYCLIFNLTESSRPSFSTIGYWLYAGEKAIIHLVESNTHFKNEKQGYLDHVAFQTTGLKGIIKKLEAMEIKYSKAYLPEIDLTQLFFKDPAGIGVEVNFNSEKL